ncbi:hypothetical protein Tco_0501465, partial [Tanacetum coccineum]
TDWSRINPRNDGKDRPDQAKDASGTGWTKELRRSEAKADGVRSWRQSKCNKVVNATILCATT